MSTLRLELPVSAEAASDAACRAAGVAAAGGWSREDCFRLQVCVAEALNNVVAHAGAAAAPLSLTCRVGAASIWVRIVDAGPPAPVPGGAQFPEAEAGGGRGWPILKHWLCGVASRRRGATNRLYLLLRRKLP